MVKLSKKERHGAYKKALSLIKYTGYICVAFQKLNFDIRQLDDFLLCSPDNWDLSHSFGYSKFHNGSTEYHACKKNGRVFRQTILMFCIEMTKPNGKKR